MQSAEAATPAPTYGNAGELEEPLDGAVLPERPVQDREHDVDPAELHSRGLSRRRRAASPSATPSTRGVRPRQGSDPAASLPAPVAPDLDRGRLVALADPVLRRTDRADAIEISCSLERPPERTATRTRGVTAPVSSSCPSRSPVKRPTNERDHRVRSAREPPTGSCDITIPSRLGSSMSSNTTLVRKPAFSSVSCAIETSWVVTSGTRRPSTGHVDTDERDRRAFRRLRCPPLGSWSTTMPSARSECDVDARHSEAVPELERGFVVGLVHDVRHDDRFRPLRDVDADTRPLDDDRSGCQALCDHVAFLTVGVHLDHLRVEPELRERRHRAVADLPDDARDAHLRLSRTRRRS